LGKLRSRWAFLLGVERFRNSGEHTLPRKPEPAWPSKAKNKSVFLTLTHEGIKLVMMIVMEGFFFS
jgi:hypothetical protein